MNESFWDRDGVRIALFVLLVVGFAGLAFFLALSQREDATSPSRPGEAAAPTTAAPVEQSTPTPAVERVPMKERVTTYLQQYQTFTWETNVDKWTARLTETGATGQALRPPFYSESLNTCVRIQCGYRDVKVSNVVEQGDGMWSADVESTFVQTGAPDTRGTMSCTVKTLNTAITDLTCLGVA